MSYRYIIYLLIILTIIGCGLMNNPKEDKITVPNKISVNIPKVLETTSGKKEKTKVESLQEIATGYSEIQKYIQVYKNILGEIKSDLLLANQIIDDITNLCDNKAFNESCIIPKKRLSLIINKETLYQINLLFPELLMFGNSQSLIGKKLYFGQIEFIRYDENQTYQYQLIMDMSEINGVMGFYDTTQPPKIIQTIKWSKDKKEVFSSITKEDKYQQNEPWTLHYHQVAKEETMHINSKRASHFSKENSSLNMSEQKESNHTTIIFNKIQKSINTSSLIVKQNSSYIEINQTKGFQKLIETTHLNTNYNKSLKEEIFDEVGRVIATTYCHSSTPECYLYNSDTWFIDSNNEALFLPFKRIEFEELKIGESNLKEGEYWLIPQGYDIGKLSIQKALELRVATFIYFVEFYQGVLFNEAYRDKLNNLQLVYVKYNENLDLFSYEKSNQLFEVIQKENYPKINLWSETE